MGLRRGYGLVAWEGVGEEDVECESGAGAIGFSPFGRLLPHIGLQSKVLLGFSVDW